MFQQLLLTGYPPRGKTILRGKFVNYGQHLDPGSSNWKEHRHKKSNKSLSLKRTRTENSWC